MRDVYKYNSLKAWKEYRAEVKRGFPYSKTAVFKLNSGTCHDGRCENDKAREPGAAFIPYWIGLELIKEGRENALKITIPELLKKCKEDYKNRLEWERSWEHKPDYYNGYPLEWRMYRPLDDSYNSFDVTTSVCELPFKASDAQKKELKESLWIDFHDPYCDGRCTGVWFTGWLKVLTAGNKTFLYHCMHCDV